MLPFEFRRPESRFEGRMLQVLLGLLGAAPFLAIAFGGDTSGAGRIVAAVFGCVTLSSVLWLGARVGSVSVTVHPDRLVVRNVLRTTTIALHDVGAIVQERSTRRASGRSQPTSRLVVLGDERVQMLATVQFVDAPESELDPLLHALESARGDHDFSMWRRLPTGTPRPAPLAPSQRRPRQRPRPRSPRRPSRRAP